VDNVTNVATALTHLFPDESRSIMHPEPTPAVQRALSAATRWHRDTASDVLGPVELLLGLLAEPECRAATILEQIDITAGGVQRQWPDLKTVPKQSNPQRPWSTEVRMLVASA